MGKNVIKSFFREYYLFHRWLLGALIKKVERNNLDYAVTLSDIKLKTVPPSTVFHHKGIGVVIGSGVDLGNNVHIFQNVTIGAKTINDDTPDCFPVIEDNVTIYAHAVVIGGVRVGHDSIIGAYSLVLKDVPPYSVVAGIPAKITKRLKK